MRPMEVTDHAVLRHLERVKGIDVEGIRRHIKKSLDMPSVRKVVDFAGDTKFKIKTNEATYCIKDRTVITCYPE